MQPRSHSKVGTGKKVVKLNFIQGTRTESKTVLPKDKEFHVML